jgi:hypothetical protein
VAGCGSLNSSSLVAASQWFHPPAGPEWLQQGSCHSPPLREGGCGGWDPATVQGWGLGDARKVGGQVSLQSSAVLY